MNENDKKVVVIWMLFAASAAIWLLFSILAIHLSYMDRSQCGFTNTEHGTPPCSVTSTA